MPKNGLAPADGAPPGDSAISDASEASNATDASVLVAARDGAAQGFVVGTGPPSIDVPAGAYSTDTQLSATWLDARR